MVEIVHIIGAGFTFIGGVVYCFLQTAMSYHMYPDYNGLLICRVRLFVCMLAFGSLISSILWKCILELINSCNVKFKLLKMGLCWHIVLKIISAIASAAVALTQYKVKDRFHWNPDEPVSFSWCDYKFRLAHYILWLLLSQDNPKLALAALKIFIRNLAALSCWL